jgi:hypothetical protein
MKWMYGVVSYFGLVQGILKVVLGIIILYFMRNHLNYYYRKRKWSIAFVIVGTIIVMGFKYLFNIQKNWRDSDFTAIFNRKYHDNKTFEILPIIGTFSLSLFNLCLEVSLMKLNIENVNFKDDITIIMKG